jgi:hypothetical protein
MDRHNPCTLLLLALRIAFRPRDVCTILPCYDIFSHRSCSGTKDCFGFAQHSYSNVASLPTFGTACVVEEALQEANCRSDHDKQQQQTTTATSTIATPPRSPVATAANEKFSSRRLRLRGGNRSPVTLFQPSNQTAQLPNPPRSSTQHHQPGHRQHAPPNSPPPSHADSAETWRGRAAAILCRCSFFSLLFRAARPIAK